MASRNSSVEVILRSVDTVDDFTERKMVLALGDTVPIGRSSRNALKKLLPAATNGFIDSPVISREHATLSADSDGVITVTDKGSMHGTLVNGRRLASGEVYALQNRDIVQFGVDVIRDQDSFIAKKFAFESKMLETSRSSFRVPDTSDDEDMDDIEERGESKKAEKVTVPATSRVPVYGTQSNPVNIEDFEDPEEDITFLGTGAEALPPIALLGGQDEDSADDDLDVDVDILEADIEVEVESEISNEAIHNGSSHGDDGDSSSGDASMDESDDSSSFAGDSEQSDEEAENNLDTLRRLKMEAMLNHEQQTTQESGFTPPPDMPSAQTSRIENANSGFMHSSPPAPFFQKVLQSQPLAPSLDIYNPFEVDSWDNADWAPPLPPRPSAPPKPTVWGPPGSEFAGPSMIRHGSMHNPWYEDPPPLIFNPVLHNALPSYLAVSDKSTSTEERDAPSAASRQPEPQPIMDLAETEDRPRTEHATTSSSVPTPPTVGDSSSPAQPVRRTKVSIQEITEIAPQPENPPTPTSMKSLKRKADVLDYEEEDSLAEELAPAPVEVAPIAVPQKEEERPRKRRFVSTALSYMATGVMGGAVAVGALMFIPEGFFA